MTVTSATASSRRGSPVATTLSRLLSCPCSVLISVHNIREPETRIRHWMSQTNQVAVASPSALAPSSHATDSVAKNRDIPRFLLKIYEYVLVWSFTYGNSYMCSLNISGL